MYCQKCGKEIDDEAVICVHCGCEIQNSSKNKKEFQESKTTEGVLLGLFLGLIGLVIGIVMYPEGTVARKTFIKAWLTTFLIYIGVCFLIGLISGIALTTTP